MYNFKEIQLFFSKMLILGHNILIIREKYLHVSQISRLNVVLKEQDVTNAFKKSIGKCFHLQGKNILYSRVFISFFSDVKTAFHMTRGLSWTKVVLPVMKSGILTVKVFFWWWLFLNVLYFNCLVEQFSLTLANILKKPACKMWQINTKWMIKKMW